MPFTGVEGGTAKAAAEVPVVLREEGRGEVREEGVERSPFLWLILGDVLSPITFSIPEGIGDGGWGAGEDGEDAGDREGRGEEEGERVCRTESLSHASQWLRELSV